MHYETGRLQEACETDLQKQDAQLDEHTSISAIQRLSGQLREKEERLREKDVRLREMEESHRRREEELLTQLRRKDVELEQKNAIISRLRRNTDLSRFPHHSEVNVVQCSLVRCQEHTKGRSIHLRFVQK